MSAEHIAVIGAGITGVTTAYALLRRGVEVSVFERHPHAALETSYANGGQLSASNAEVWTHWGTVLKGLKWMLQADAPLLFNPRPSWHKISWVAEFLASIPRYQANTIQTVKLAVAARRFMFEWAEAEGIDFDHVKRGILHFYRSEKEWAAAKRVNEIYVAAGLDRRELRPEEVREIEPTLHGHFLGGFYTPSDSTGCIRKFTRGLAEACVRRGGVFHYGAEVAVVPEGRQYRIGEQLFDKVVICAGVGSRDLAASLGDRVNIYPVKGYSITVNMPDAASQKAAPWVSLLDDQAKIVTSRLGPDRFRVAGTAEFNGFNRDIRADRIKPLIEWTRTLFPGINTGHVEPWAGLRPMMPDMMPRVGAGKRAGVFYNTGHGHLGWTLSAITAEMIATQVAGAEPMPLAQAA